MNARESSSETRTVTETLSPTSQVCLVNPQTNRGVTWSSETVDNEDMGKKSSKCCCIYHKPRTNGESSSESDSSGSDDNNPYEKNKLRKKHSSHRHEVIKTKQPDNPNPT